MANPYTLSKKTRSSQVHQSDNKKVSVQSSRSSLRFHPTALQNGESKCSNSKHSDDGGLNGFLDGPLIRAQRSKRSPDLSAHNVRDSPICNSYATVVDNGSEIAINNSGDLSNNVGSAVESDHKHEQSDIISGNFEGLELCRRLNFQEKTTVMRKKRNPVRKRVLKYTSRTCQRVSNERLVQLDPLVLPALCESLIDSRPKDEGDEHLPLSKRARVRMEKLSAEEHQQFDLLAKNEDKSFECVSTSSFTLASTSLNCGDSDQPKRSSTMSKLMVSAPVNNLGEVPEDKPQATKTDICVVNEQLACLPVDNGVHISGDKAQPQKTKANLPFGGVFDDEAALPPLKRLHRALEAMSANAAEETKTSVAVSLAIRKNVSIDEAHFPPPETSSFMFVNDEIGNTLKSHHDSAEEVAVCADDNYLKE